MTGCFSSLFTHSFRCRILNVPLPVLCHIPGGDNFIDVRNRVLPAFDLLFALAAEYSISDLLIFFFTIRTAKSQFGGFLFRPAHACKDITPPFGSNRLGKTGSEQEVLGGL